MGAARLRATRASHLMNYWPYSKRAESHYLIEVSKEYSFTQTQPLAMGKYDFRPMRVHQTATQLLNTERITKTPPWYNVVGSITPAQTLVRTQPLPHQPRKGKTRTKKASKLFQPQNIHYEEDALRKEFFKDHPWELARPRLVIEDDGKDSQKTDWSRIEQPEKALSGER